MRASDPNPELAALLRSREARGLRVPAIGRVFFCAISLVLVVMTTDFADETMVSPVLGAILTVVLVGVLLFNGMLIVHLNQLRSVERWGLIGASVDAVFVIAMPLLGVAAGAEDGLNPAYMYETELPVAILTVAVINGLALRPRYPAIVGAGAVVAMVIPAVLALLDPSTQWSTVRAEAYGGAAFEPSSVGAQVVMVAGAVLAVVFAAHAARQTVIEGIERQLEHARLQQEQLRIVMREKVTTLRKIVAGVCHEVNTPIGAVASSADTLRRVFDKLPDEGGAQRYLQAGRQSLSAIQVAAQRLSALETSLRTLSHLDEADVREVDLNEALGEVVETARRNLATSTRVETDLAALPALLLDGPQVSQALLTLMTNAFEAAGPEGTVTVRSASDGDAVQLEIADDGPGLEPEALARIFDVSLAGRSDRVAVGLGLAAAQNAAHRHGGELTAHSTPGAGARFVLRLPTAPQPTADD